MSDSTEANPCHTNRLAQESSPYLLQHAHNPVHWFPWGPEAFEKARREDKPIFLSVGYSTCYWCHVMERESFENEAVAAEMNRLFICIKVDREERPDVDQLYMTAVQLITRHGGWPMSVWLTPDLRPFYGGTYFPQANFIAYLRGLDDAYRNRHDEVERTADQITNILRRLARPVAAEKPLMIDDQFIHALLDRSISDYDSRHGGFGGAPKFPRETLLEFLLVSLNDGGPSSAAGFVGSALRTIFPRDGESVRSADPTQIENRKSKIENALFRTLDAMAQGGIRDQLGGGFHRYSTDAQWLVPHFEIMLYDNAMLGWVYAEAFRQTRETRYANIARGIFDFVLREMTSPQGAFYTAFDAEVDAQEGLSYLWTESEIESILGNEDAKLFDRVYGVDRGPNFADPHHGTGTPDKSILFLPKPLPEVAAELKLDATLLEERLAPMRKKLYDVRLKRKQPSLDTKIITSWNALMIRGLAHAGHVLNEPQYIEAAAKAAEFLLHHHLTDGTLARTSRDGKSKHRGFLDDYAFLAQALLSLRDATGDDQWTRHATTIGDSMVEKFADTAGGGFYFTESQATDLIVRQKTAQDSPLPSGNAVAAMVLLELGRKSESQSTLAAFAQQLADQGEAMSSMAEAALLYVRKQDAIAVLGSSTASDADRPATPQQIAAGVVSVKTEWTSAAALRVRLNILKGFHINTHDAGGEMSLIPTRLSVDAAGAKVAYPQGEEQVLPFLEKPMRVYSGEVTFMIQFSQPLLPEQSVKLILSYQACDEKACFPPATKQIEVEVPSVH